MRDWLFEKFGIDFYTDKYPTYSGFPERVIAFFIWKYDIQLFIRSYRKQVD